MVAGRPRRRCVVWLGRFGRVREELAVVTKAVQLRLPVVSICIRRLLSLVHAGLLLLVASVSVGNKTPFGSTYKRASLYGSPVRA